MKSDDCNHWAILSDRLAVEDALSFEERKFLAEHRKSCAECAAEAELFEEMSSCLEENSAMLFLRTSTDERPRAMNRRRWWVIGGASLAAAAVVSLAMVGTYESTSSSAGNGASLSAVDVVPLGSVPVSENRSAVDLLFVAGEVTVSGQSQGAGTPLQQGDRIETKRGRVCFGSGRSATLCLEEGSELEVHTAQKSSMAPLAKELSAVTEQGVVLTRGTLSYKQESVGQVPFVVQTKWAKIRGFGASFVVGYMDSGQAFLRLHEGRIRVELHGGGSSEAEGRSAFSIGKTWENVALEKGRFEEDQAYFESMAAWSTTRLSPVEIQSDPPSSEVTWDGQAVGITPVSMMATPGEHKLEISLDGYVKLDRIFKVEGRERITQTFVLASAPTPNVHEQETTKSEGPRVLLLRAQALRSKGDFTGASVAYEHLIRSYPQSGEGRAALVSLGELSLSQLGTPQKALASFEQYLRGGGPLNQEASYGKIRALRALGREEEARALGRNFVAQYPDSAQAVSLRRWL